eukprot:jgi/Bigna1/33309/e_gw1.1.413.1
MRNIQAWAWFRSLGSPRFALGPMVGQSELAFRLLCRRYGATLGYTPMFIADSFVNDPSYRARVWRTCKQDRPLVVQFCGRDPETLVAAGKLRNDKNRTMMSLTLLPLLGSCDAVDLNLGCPQSVAKRGGYGAFLMDDWPLLSTIVGRISEALSIPVLCKVRVFADVEKTVAYCKMLEEAGASLLAVHPRQRHQREEVLAEWAQVARVKEAVKIPLFCNGDVYHTEDALLCLKESKADGIMSAQGLLHNPSLFHTLAMTTAEKASSSSVGGEAATARSPSSSSPSSRHLFFILFDQFHANLDIFDALAQARCS